MLSEALDPRVATLPYPAHTSPAHPTQKTDTLPMVTVMAAELQPPDNQIPAATDVSAATTAAVAAAAATTTTVILPVQTEPPAGPPLAPKRQRRPSVRLGEIGDQPSYDSHVRRTKPQPHTWRLPKDPSSKSIKARSLTNLVNGGDSHDYQETDDKDHNVGGGDNTSNLEFTHRKVKSKRAPTTKRARTNWVSRVDEGAEVGDSRDDGDGDETFRDFDPDSDSQLKDQSPVHSVDNVALDFWPGQRRPGPGRARVSESRENEFDNNLESERGGGGGEGVRSWLIELGLSRYAPVFEIHEVDDEVLPMLTLEDLKDMGINAVGSRRKLYTAIQKLRKGFS